MLILTSTITLLVLSVALSLVIFAGIIFIVNNYLTFLDAAEKSVTDDDQQGWFEEDFLFSPAGAEEDYNYFTPDHDYDKQGAEQLAEEEFKNRSPKSQYYPASADEKSSVPSLFPVFGAGILMLSSILVATLYWRSRD